LAAHVEVGRRLTAEILVLIGEVDSRRLYRGEGYASMHLYCIRELHFSESAAFRRITAARLARHFPEIVDAIADGRLHLTAIVELAPKLSPASGRELLAAAEYRTRAEILQLLAERFPTTESMPLLVPQSMPNAPIVPAARSTDARSTGPSERQTPDGRLPGTTPDGQPSSGPGHAGLPGGARPPSPNDPTHALVPRPVEPMAPDPVARGVMAPIAHDRFSVHLSIGSATRDKLEHARALLSHALPGGDLSEVLDRALDALIADLEKRKFGATTNPRATAPAVSANPRYIPHAVRRQVWARDGGRCTFVGHNGQRCEMRRFLEYDHVQPVALGGLATVDNVRLRCRAHNQFEAERILGRAALARREAPAGGTARARAEDGSAA
jgi:hypothetical protein